MRIKSKISALMLTICMLITSVIPAYAINSNPGINEDVPQCEGYSVAKLENPGKTTWVDVVKSGKYMMVGFEYDKEIRSLHEDSYIAIKWIDKREDPREWMEFSSLIDIRTTIEGTPILLDIKFVDRSGRTEEAVLEEPARFYIQLGDAFEIEDVKACYLRVGTDERLNTSYQSVVTPRGPIECLRANINYISNKMLIAEMSTNSRALPEKTTNKAVAKKGKIKVSWNPIYGVDGYQIGYRRIGKKTWEYSLVKKASTKGKTLTKLKKCKKYTVKVRPYIKTSKHKKIYGKWLKCYAYSR